ncbi:alpha/beta hydrolase [Rhizobium sp. P38BS-XIX]|uniref:alpha/beta hydrolase n=1 Tax=Rhizobium sp. P38BS-XIX TaxID=2726740 RepID=UPI001457589D|nr:alpha/beta hydrolase [Rhizobium sp. P38BS-XIX]NLS00489.1 alpha/beta hydrolase [Rhizobium sp. P38BS-XIX]
MSNFSIAGSENHQVEFIAISDDEREREAALRLRFASFWGSATGEPRDIYDTFVSATPIAVGVSFEPVITEAVHGWWVRPESSQTGSALLFLHGGGYVQGRAKAYRGLVSQIVARTQIPALVIDYPLAPEATLPAAPHAALAAWNWLLSQGFERVAVVGDSAGGGLSLVTIASLSQRDGGIKPLCGVVFSPWTDLAFTGRSMTDPDVVDPLIGYDYLQDCATKYVGTMSPDSPLASPLHGDLGGLPPILIQVGTDEKLLDDSRQYEDRAAAAGVPVRLEIWEGMHHVFQLDIAHLESSRLALDRAAAFLRNASEHPISR